MADFIIHHPVISLLVIFGIVLLIYLIGSLATGKSVMNSQKLLRGTKTTAEMVYYLPTASLQLAATAKVIVATDVNQNIISATLAELSFENTVSFVADTDFAFALNYEPSAFAADEVKFTVGPSGLLDSINTTTTDRLSNLISEIGTLPSVLNPRMVSLVDPSPQEQPAITNTQTVSHCKNFYVPLEGANAQKIYPWSINADGNTNKPIATDASFVIEFAPLLNDQYSVPDQAIYNGVLTRPLQTFKMTITSADPAVDPPLRSTYELRIPDTSSLISVPIQRSSFIKRINTPKFSNGLLLENYINKPSEFEGFASIPINIGKALVSIPAQLFTFTLKKNNKPDSKTSGIKKQQQKK